MAPKAPAGRCSNGPGRPGVRPVRGALEPVALRRSPPDRASPSGTPPQTAPIESFDGRFRDEWLNLYWVRSLQHARQEIGR